MTKLSLAFDVLTRGAPQAEDHITRVGNASEHAGHKVEKTGGAMRLLGSTFTSASNQALGPLQEIADKFDIIERAGESATTKVGGRLLGLGAAGLGAGSFLSTLASREVQGGQQLRAAIEQSGHDYEDFAENIEKVVKSGEHFGYQNATTLDALNRLTITTHNPAEALRDLAVAQDVATAKHVDLARAAEIVGLTFNGSTRAGKQFGLQLEDTKKAAADLSSAQRAVATANDHVTAAQQSYNDKLAVYRQTLSPTLSQLQSLYRSHQDLTKAQHDQAAAADRLKTAQDKASQAADAGARNVAKLAAVTKGQAEAAADSFSGHLRAVGADIEGWAAKVGENYGGAINTISLGTIAVGTLIETGVLPKLGALIGRLGLTGTAFETLRDVEIATTAEGAAAVEAGAAKEILALQGVTAAEGEVGLAAGGMSASMLGAFGAMAAGAAGLATEVVLPLADVVAVAQESWKRISAIKDLFDGNFGPLNKLTNPTGADLGIGERGLPKLPPLQLHPRGVQTDDAYDAKTSATLQQQLDNYGKRSTQSVGEAAKRTAAAQQKAIEDNIEKWRKAMGLEAPANAILKAAADEAARAAKQAAVDAATAVRDRVKAEFDNAKRLLNDVMGQAKQLRESIAGSLVQGSQILDVFGTGPNLNANHAFGSGADFERVKKFFEDRLTRLRRFATEINVLVHKGLDPAIVAQIAQAGLEQGGRLADALSGSTKGQLGEINNLNRQVTTIADSAGRRVSDVQYREQIAAAKKTNDILSKQLTEANAHLRVISRTKPSVVDARAQAFLLRS
jgi:hypothetical protein